MYTGQELLEAWHCHLKDILALSGVIFYFLFNSDWVMTCSFQAMTDDNYLTPERQASKQMVAHPYQTTGGNYLHIGKQRPQNTTKNGGVAADSSIHCILSHEGVDTAELTKGDNFKINLNIQRKTREAIDITYLVREIFLLFCFALFCC